MTGPQAYWAHPRYRFVQWYKQLEVDRWFETYGLSFSEPTHFADVLSDLLRRLQQYRQQGHTAEDVEIFERDSGAEVIQGILTNISTLVAHRHREDASTILKEVNRVLATGDKVQRLVGRPMLPPPAPRNKPPRKASNDSDSDSDSDTSPLTATEITTHMRTTRQPGDSLPIPEIRIHAQGNIPLAVAGNDNKIILNRLLTEHAQSEEVRNGIFNLLTGSYNARGKGIPYYRDNPTDVVRDLPHESKVPFISAPINGDVNPELYLDQTRWPMLNIDDIRLQAEFGHIQPENYIYQFMSLVRETLCLPEVARRYVIILRGHPSKYQDETPEQFEDEPPPTAEEVECIIKLISMTFPNIEIELDIPPVDSDSESEEEETVPTGDGTDSDDDDDDGDDNDNDNDNDNDDDDDDDDDDENMDDDRRDSIVTFTDTVESSGTSHVSVENSETHTDSEMEESDMEDYEDRMYDDGPDDNEMREDEMREGEMGGGEMGEGVIDSDKVEEGEMSGGGMGNDEVDDHEMSDDEVGEDEMSDNEVDEDEMSDNEVDENEMSDDEMGNDEMGNDEMSDDEMDNDDNDIVRGGDNDMDESGVTSAPMGIRKKSRSFQTATRRGTKRKARNRIKHKYDSGVFVGDYGHHDRFSYPAMITLNGASFNHIESLHRQGKPYAHLLYFLFTVMNHEMGHYLNTLIWIGESPGAMFDTPRRLRWWVQDGTTEYEYSPDYRRFWSRMGEMGEVIEWLTSNYMLEYDIGGDEQNGLPVQITCMGSHVGFHKRYPTTGLRQMELNGYAGTQMLRGLPPIRMPSGDELRTFLDELRQQEIQAAAAAAAIPVAERIRIAVSNASLAASAIKKAVDLTSTQAINQTIRQYDAKAESSRTQGRTINTVKTKIPHKKFKGYKFQQNIKELLRTPKELDVRIIDVEETFTGRLIGDTPVSQNHRYRRAVRDLRKQLCHTKFRKISNLPEMSPKPNIIYGPQPVKPIIRALPESLQPVILVFLVFGLSFLANEWTLWLSSWQPWSASGKLAKALKIFITGYIWFWIWWTWFYPLGKRFKNMFGTSTQEALPRSKRLSISQRDSIPQNFKSKRASGNTAVTILGRVWHLTSQNVFYPAEMILGKIFGNRWAATSSMNPQA